MHVDCIDYRNLDQQNPLFLAYLYEFEKVRELFLQDPLNEQLWVERFHRVRSRPRFSRQALKASLQATHQAVGAGSRSLENLERLSSDKALAVVTGQQVGVLGGPAYSVYKALTAVKLARQLESRGQAAVPVFWLAGDDSDFEEVCKTLFLTTEGDSLQLRYPDLRTRPEQMVGEIELSSIEELLGALEIPDSTTAQQTWQLLRRAYRPVSNFRVAFGSWVSQLFEEEGLLVFDPLAPQHRPALGEFFQTAVSNREEIVSRLQQRSRLLTQKGYTPQVAFDETETLLFFVEQGCRYKLEFKRGRFVAKNRDSHSWSKEELLKSVQKEPERFGTSALLRPILQDVIFPTALYVGGPGEIAYFAQVTAIAGLWDVEPAIFPRMALTLIDRRTQRLLRKYDLSVPEIFAQHELELAERILRTSPSASILEGFDSLRANLQRDVEDVRKRLEIVDRPVADMLETASSKIGYQIDKVHRRFLDNQKRREGDLRRHTNILRNSLLPKGTPQERVMNFNQFLLGEGVGFISDLLENSELFCRGHQLVYL